MRTRIPAMLALAMTAMLAMALACSSSPAPAAQPVASQPLPQPAQTAQQPAPAALSSSATAQPPSAPAPATAASTPTKPPAPAFDKAAYAKVPNIVDPSNFSWPRKVMTATGEVEIKQKPQRIHTLSLGADEITLALLPPSRVAAVGAFTANTDFSNVADMVKDLPKIPRNAEAILAVKPDIVLISQFSNAALVKQIQEAGITTVLAEPQGLNPSASVLEGYETTIRYLAYVYGEEEAAEQLIASVRARLDRVKNIVDKQATSARPRVLFYQVKKFAHGSNTNADGIIRAAGGVNVAAEAGIVRVQEIGQEAIAKMNPDVIIVTQTDLEEQRVALSGNPALAQVPAVKNGRIYSLAPKQVDTLSPWNTRGVEDLAKLLWPQAFAGVEFGQFP
jgi:iron complex transport system substrate-binding protein